VVMIIILGVLLKMLKIIWVTKEEILLEREMHNECIIILSRANVKTRVLFFFAIKVDDNGCMGNCFWVDARSHAAYQYFGDVVPFDATYLTNRYKMALFLLSKLIIIINL
jgi:hypothetical protein